MNRVLFLCSANYYRSRFAEHYFNWLADENNLDWQADSRGLMVGHWGDLGTISHYCIDRLHSLGIPTNGNYRLPMQLSVADLNESTRVIALKEAEHRTMMEKLFPSWVDQIEYWHIDDIDCADPTSALPVIENHVQSLVEHLAQPHPIDRCTANEPEAENGGNTLASRSIIQANINKTLDAQEVVQEAKRRILHQPHLSQQRIWCECRDGQLSLHGQVPSFYFKQLAQEAVLGMDGVRRIDNEIEVIW